MDRFEELLKELGQIVNVPLHPDKHRLCRLNVNNLLHVQLEYDEVKQNLLVATFIAELPAGKPRETILKEALKANGDFVEVGKFGYVERNNQLALFEYLPAHALNGERLAKFLAKFIQRADGWRVAIESGGPLPIKNG